MGKVFSAVLKFGIPPLFVSAFSGKLLAFRGCCAAVKNRFFGHFLEEGRKVILSAPIIFGPDFMGRGGEGGAI